jgi:hypothetical protein
MKTFFTIAFAALLIGTASFVQQPTGSSDKPAKGWKKLFDGKSKKGWHTYLNDGDGSSWVVEDGMLVFVPNTEKNPSIKKGGDLTTDLEYENYHFSLEWKISEGGNSGIIFGVKEDPQYKRSYNTGLEMQVLDNDRHNDGKIIKHRAGDLYDLISCSRETVKPVGEWNKAEIVLNNGDLRLFLNGEEVVHTTLWDDNWNKMVAGSKFKTMPGFGKYKKGRIALQDHGDKVWFRNIKIKEL